MTHFKNNIIQYWERLDESWRFALTAFLIARLLYLIWSWVILTIQPVALQNFELSGEQILSIFKLENSEAHIYLRQIDGKILTFQNKDSQHIVDQQTGSVWEIASGTAVQGPYRGSMLLPAETKAPSIFPYAGVKPVSSPLLALWQRFDANIYTAIAQDGYGTIPGDTHFPPLFPLLTRLLQSIAGNTFLAGLLVSHIATLCMLKLLYDVFVQWGGKTNGRRALLLFIIYPTFFFFFSAYSESVFLVSVLLALRSMHSRSWAWSGFWTFCAILTRLQGVALLIPMAYLMHSDGAFLRKFSHWMAFTMAGIGGLLYLYVRSRQHTVNTLPFVESEWQARLALPGASYLYAIRTMVAGNATFIDTLNFVIATLFVILVIAGWKKIPLEYNLYTVFNLFILSIRIVETQPLNSMSRFSLTLFPVFYTLSLKGQNPWLRRAIVYTSILLNLYLSGQFFIWGWVA